MKILLTGATGQIATALARRLSAKATVVVTDRATLDLSRPGSIPDAFDQVAPLGIDERRQSGFECRNAAVTSNARDGQAAAMLLGLRRGRDAGPRLRFCRGLLSSEHQNALTR